LGQQKDSNQEFEEVGTQKKKNHRPRKKSHKKTNVNPRFNFYFQKKTARDFTEERRGGDTAKWGQKNQKNCEKKGLKEKKKRVLVLLLGGGRVWGV